jgi:hypothetical protein
MAANGSRHAELTTIAKTALAGAVQSTACVIQDDGAKSGASGEITTIDPPVRATNHNMALMRLLKPGGAIQA